MRPAGVNPGSLQGAVEKDRGAAGPSPEASLLCPVRFLVPRSVSPPGNTFCQRAETGHPDAGAVTCLTVHFVKTRRRRLSVTQHAYGKRSGRS